jgi:cell division protein FtsI (penicillin-binding protein 3)
MREKAQEKRRLFVFIVLLCACAAGLLVKLVHLMVVIPAREGEAALVLPEVERGAILDRWGRILAITTKKQTVSAWAPTISDPEETARLLAGVLGMNESDIRDLWKNRPGYSIVKHRISDEQTAAIRALMAEGKLAGIRLEDEYGRSYPEGKLASHAVGWLGSDNVARGGIEFTLSDELSPQPVGTESDTVFGNHVFLTIDINAQFIVEKTARAAFNSTRADSLMIIVMDAKTAEVLAYCSLPDFDPNEFQKEIRQVTENSLINRPITLAYEPGSVFKIFSISSLLELGAITSGSRFVCPGYYEYKDKDETKHINDLRAHGEVTPQLILKYSCNVGAAYASDLADKASFYRMLVRFGFGKQTGIPLSGETAGILAKVEDWSGRSKATIAMGQEVSVSAIQVVSAATALTNGGVLLKPAIVRKIVSPDGRTIKEFGREPLWEVLSPGTAREILDMMETATEEGGTARRAAVPGLRISAKTGTAQTVNPETKRYSETDFIASTIGIFPTEDPRYIAYVVIQNPRGESYLGSTIAVPVLKDVILGLSDYYGIARAGQRTATHSGEIEVKVPRQIEIGAVMPDLTGTPKRLLLPLLLRQDIKVRIKGSGYVVRQTPPAGAAVENGSEIVLELE